MTNFVSAERRNIGVRQAHIALCPRARPTLLSTNGRKIFTIKTPQINIAETDCRLNSNGQCFNVYAGYHTDRLP